MTGNLAIPGEVKPKVAFGGGGGSGGGGMGGLMKGLMGGGAKKKKKKKDAKKHINGEEYGLLIEKQNEINAANYSTLVKEQTMFLHQKNMLKTQNVLNSRVVKQDETRIAKLNKQNYWENFRLRRTAV